MARILEGRNRANADEAASFVDKFEELEKEIREEKAASAGRIAGIKKRQSALLDDAKSQGVEKKIVRAAVKLRALQRQLDTAVEDLEADDKAFVIDIRKALGDFADTPLGAAAAAAEDSEQDETTAAIVSAVQSDEAAKAASAGGQ